MKKIYLLLLFLIVIKFSNSQIVTIKNENTGEAIEFAIIHSNSTKAYTQTNSKGQANIEQFKNCENIEIQSLGYKTKKTTYSELEKNSFNILLTQTNINLDEIVISASKWSQSSKDIPSRIISIPTQEIILQNPQTAADLLGSSGEVFIQKSQQGGGSPMIRGFSTNRLLYTIDGIRMNTAIFRSGNIQNVISLDAFATEKTEVFFGPGSVIYGSDAIGGVMSFQTLTPQLTLTDKPFISGKTITRYSSANSEKTAHFDINLGFKKWASTTSFSSSDFGNLKMGSYGPEEYLRNYYVQRIDNVDVIVTNNDPKIQNPSGYSQINLMQKIRFTPNENWDIQYGYHYSETSSYSRYDRHIRYKNGLPRYGEWSYGPQKWMMNNLTITNTKANLFYNQLIIRLAQQFFEESRISRDINKPDREIRTEKVNAYSLNIDFNKEIGKKQKVIYGIELVQNDVNSTGINEDISTGTKVTGASRYPQSTWDSYAAYLSYQYKISEKLLFQTGARYNLYKLNAKFDTTFYHFPFTTAKINNGAITGSLGLIYHPTEKWTISANASTGFRSPNVDDLGKVFDSEPGYVVVPNPNLEAEYAYNAEIGIAKVFEDILKIDFAAYYTILENAMVRRDFTLNGNDSIMYDGTMSKVQAIQNAAVANVYGVQAGLEIQLGAGFGFSTDFNYQKGTEELDDGTTSPSRHAAPMFGNSKLFYSANKLNMQFYTFYSAGKTFEELPLEEQSKTEIYAIDENGKPYSPSWYTLNFKANYQFTDNLLVGAGIENITDQRYKPYSSGIVAAGRNFVISIKANF